MGGDINDASAIKLAKLYWDKRRGLAGVHNVEWCHIPDRLRVCVVYVNQMSGGTDVQSVLIHPDGRCWTLGAAGTAFDIRSDPDMTITQAVELFKLTGKMEYWPDAGGLSHKHLACRDDPILMESVIYDGPYVGTFLDDYNGPGGPGNGYGDRN